MFGLAEYSLRVICLPERRAAIRRRGATPTENNSVASPTRNRKPGWRHRASLVPRGRESRGTSGHGQGRFEKPLRVPRRSRAAFCTGWLTRLVPCPPAGAGMPSPQIRITTPNDEALIRRAPAEIARRAGERTDETTRTPGESSLPCQILRPSFVLPGLHSSDPPRGNAAVRSLFR